ncbi:dephospho-CoA kinase [Chloroflexota bacterium]
MKVIGLTGCIGSGKSAVSRFLAELGAAIIEADKLGHEAYTPGTEAWRKVVAAFGRQITGADGSIDREKLGKIVFSDAKARERLNRIMHPGIYSMIEDRLEEHRKGKTGVVVVEAPLLLEANWASLADEVWITAASEATILKRLKERRKLSEYESLARLRSQLPLGKRLEQADVVIDTEGSLEELKAKIKMLWEKLQAGI